jgi:DNA-binding transcriptional regulator YiaG
MANHPNRSRAGNADRNPHPDEIVSVRAAAGLTQAQCAKLLYTSLRSWAQWEYGERKMHPAFWELLKIKIMRHPIS